MNSVNLVGRLTHDPELKQTAGGMATTSFRIAVQRDYKKEGQPEADFLRVVVFGKQAESVATYCHKGKQVGVIGRIQTGSYTKQDGTKVYTTDIVADRVEFYGGSAEGRKATESTAIPEGFHAYNEEDDGIPF